MDDFTPITIDSIPTLEDLLNSQPIEGFPMPADFEHSSDGLKYYCIIA